MLIWGSFLEDFLESFLKDFVLDCLEGVEGEEPSLGELGTRYLGGGPLSNVACEPALNFPLGSFTSWKWSLQ